MFKLNNWNKVQLKSFLLIILIGYITQSTFAQENSTKRANLKGKIISIDPGHGGLSWPRLRKPGRSKFW